MFARLRTGLHKHAKEGLLCLLESCTGEEYDKVRAAPVTRTLLFLPPSPPQGVGDRAWQAGCSRRQGPGSPSLPVGVRWGWMDAWL